MKREKIELTSEDLRDVIYEEAIWDKETEEELFHLEHNETTYTDLEKGYEKLTVIIKRLSDDKYFKCEGIIDSPYTGFDNEVFTEVLRNVETKTVEVVTWK